MEIGACLLSVFKSLSTSLAGQYVKAFWRWLCGQLRRIRELHARYDALVSENAALVFFFNDTATTEIYTLPLHDALPISPPRRSRRSNKQQGRTGRETAANKADQRGRSEEHTSELQSPDHLVCRLLL